MQRLPARLAELNRDCPLFQKAVAANLLYPDGSFRRPVSGDPVEKPHMVCNGFGWLWWDLHLSPAGICPYCVELLEAGRFVDRDRTIKTFKSFETPSAKHIEALSRVYTWATLFSNGSYDQRGLCLWGPMGSGKSHLLSALYSHAQIHKPGFSARWLPAHELHRLAGQKSQWSNEEERHQADEELELTKEIPFLFVDDLGSEPRDDELRRRGFVDEFRAIVLARYERQLPIFLTTNWYWRPQKESDREKSLMVYGAREAERLWETCDEICVNLPSWRTRK